MKITLQAILTSIIIHLFYFIGIMGVGYIKAKNYQPDLSDTYDDVYYLDSKVAFSTATSPLSIS